MLCGWFPRNLPRAWRCPTSPVFRFVSLPVFPDGRAEGDQNSGGTISVGQNDLAIFRHFLPFFAVKSWILCSNHGGWSWILQDLYHFISRVWHHFRKLAVLGGYTSCFWARPYIIYQFVGYIYISYIYIYVYIPLNPWVSLWRLTHSWPRCSDLSGLSKPSKPSILLRRLSWLSWRKKITTSSW